MTNRHKPLSILQNSRKSRKYEIQCHVLHTSVPVRVRNHMLSPVCSTPPPPLGRSVQKMADREGGGAGAGASWEPSCEAGKSSNQCVHHDAPRLPQQGDLYHIEDGSGHIGGTRRITFWVCVRKGTTMAIIWSRIHSRVWICAAGWQSIPFQRQGGKIDSPVYPYLWQ